MVWHSSILIPPGIDGQGRIKYREDKNLIFKNGISVVILFSVYISPIIN